MLAECFNKNCTLHVVTKIAQIWTPLGNPSPTQGIQLYYNHSEIVLFVSVTHNNITGIICQKQAGKTQVHIVQHIIMKPLLADIVLHS